MFLCRLPETKLLKILSDFSGNQENYVVTIALRAGFQMQ